MDKLKMYWFTLLSLAVGLTVLLWSLVYYG